MNKPIKLVGTKIQPGTAADARVRAEGRMRAPLREISDSWAKSIATQNAISLRAVYQRALDSVKVQADKDKYGENAVDLLFERHAISADYKRDYRNVGERIDKTLFNSIEKYNESAPSNSQPPISWSHLIALARISDRDLMLEMARRSVEEGWASSVLGEKVTELIRLDPEKGHGGKSGQLELRPTAATNKINQAAKSLLKAFTPLDSEEFLPRLDAVADKDVEKSYSNVMEARKALEAIRANIEDRIVTLDSAAQFLSHRRDTPSTKKKAIEDKSQEDDTHGTESNDEARPPAAKKRTAKKKATTNGESSPSNPKTTRKTSQKPSADGTTPSPRKKKKRRRPRVVGSEASEPETA